MLKQFSHILLLPRWHCIGICLGLCLFFWQSQGWFLFPFFSSHTHDAWSTGCFLSGLCFPPGLFVVFIVFFCLSLLAKVNLLFLVSAIIKGWLFWHQPSWLLILFTTGEENIYCFLFFQAFSRKQKHCFCFDIIILETYYYWINSIIYICACWNASVTW